ITIAPFSFPRNFAKSFFSFASKYTTAPVIAPGVLGDHPAAAIVSGCSVGPTIRALAVPRAHERSIVHPSRCAFTAPYFANMSRVQSFACLSCGEPVSRAPMLSDKYSRFAAASLCSRISLRICTSAAKNGLFSSAAAPAIPPRTTAKASTTSHTDTPIRRNLIHLPQIQSGFYCRSHHATVNATAAHSLGPTRFLRRTQASQPFHAWLATYPAYANAALAGTSGKNGCCALQQSLAGSPSRNGNSASLRVHTPDDAADILPARPQRQENRKSTTRAPKSLCARHPAKLAATPAPVSYSAPLPAASDESWLATNFRPHKYFRLPATRFDSVAAP